MRHAMNARSKAMIASSPMITQITPGFQALA
jgi:hypothetical protein